MGADADTTSVGAGITADFAQYAPRHLHAPPNFWTTHWQRIATDFHLISGSFSELSHDNHVICGATCVC